MTMNLRHAAAILALIAVPAGSLAAQTTSAANKTAADPGASVTVFRGSAAEPGEAASTAAPQTTVFRGGSASVRPADAPDAASVPSTVFHGPPQTGTVREQSR